MRAASKAVRKKKRAEERSKRDAVAKAAKAQRRKENFEKFGFRALGVPDEEIVPCATISRKVSLSVFFLFFFLFFF